MAVDLSPYGSYIEPLTELVLTIKPKRILEIGIGHHGLSTRTWLGNSSAIVTSVDKNDWNNSAGELREQYGRNRLLFLQGYSGEVLPELRGDYDFIFIDGDHAYEGAYEDIKNCQKLLSKDGVIVIDDYGVKRSAVNLDETGGIIEGDFGVQEATDELMKGWKQVYKNIPLANGAVCFKR